MSAVDFETSRRVEVGSRVELIELLRSDGTPLRLAGSGSQQDRVPAPAQAVTVVGLGGLRDVVRLDVADGTCSVQPGLPRVELDALLEEHGLGLPCPGMGTVGGLLATDAWAPLAPGALSARSVLLGMEGVLGDGVAFKSGARVVKSVAGFDLHKLFVGSRGRVCAATLLHLKLRRLPRCRIGAEVGALPADEAWRRWHALRRASPPAQAIVLRREGGAWRLQVTLAGHRGHAATVLAQHGLEETAPRAVTPMAVAAGTELVQALIAPSRIAEVVATLPGDAPVWVGGTGQLQAVLAPADADRCLSAVASAGGAAEILVADRARRGRRAGGDPGAVALQQRLLQALDPNRRLA